MNLLVILFFLVAPAAHADLYPEAKKLPACAKDAADFCARPKPNTVEYVRCMQKHLGELAPDCKVTIEKAIKNLEERKAEERSAREACSDDFFNLCQGVGLDEESRKSCLLRHKRQLSEACAKALQLKK